MRCFPALLAAFLSCATSHGAVLLNGGFESGNLDPWFEDREFGTNRGWLVGGGGEPHAGSLYAFTLGQIELRQNFAPILGSEIQSFSFFFSHQFANRGDAALELFYGDGSSSGLQTVALDPARLQLWDEFDVLPLVDPARELAGFSFVGAPNDVVRLDSVQITVVPEPSSSTLLVAALGLLAAYRRRPL